MRPPEDGVGAHTEPREQQVAIRPVAARAGFERPEEPVTGTRCRATVTSEDGLGRRSRILPSYPEGALGTGSIRPFLSSNAQAAFLKLATGRTVVGRSIRAGLERGSRRRGKKPNKT